MGTQAQTAISKHPVTEWNKSTVADGTYLNDKTITPLRDRDVELAKIIDGLDTKFPNNQDLEELERRVSENEDKIEDIKEDIGPTSARNLVVSIESKLNNLPPKKSGSVVNVRAGDSALIVRKSDDDEDVYKFESYVFESDEGNDKWQLDEELVDVYTKDGVDNLLDDFDALPDMTNANDGDVLTVTVNAGTKKAEWKESTGGVGDSYYNFAIENDCNVDEPGRDVALGLYTSAFGNEYTNTQTNVTYKHPAFAAGFSAVASAVNAANSDSYDPGSTIAMGYCTSAIGHNQHAFGYHAYAGGVGGNFVFNTMKKLNGSLCFDNKINEFWNTHSGFGTDNVANENFVYNSVITSKSMKSPSVANHNIALNNSYVEGTNQSFYWRSCAINEDETEENVYESSSIAENILYNSYLYYKKPSAIAKNHVEMNGVISACNGNVTCQNFMVGGILINANGITNNNVILSPGETGDHRNNPAAIVGYSYDLATSAIGYWPSPWGSRSPEYKAPVIVNAQKSFVVHDNWIYGANGSTVIGEDNFIQGTSVNAFNYTFGNGNATSACVLGYNLGTSNQQIATKNGVGGSSCTVNFNIGQTNLIYSSSAHNCMNFGVGNIADGDCNINIGLGLSGTYYQTIVGKYNKPISEYANRWSSLDAYDASKAAIFIIGNGQLAAEADGYAEWKIEKEYDTWEYDTWKYVPMRRNEDVIIRSNAMVVYQDGHAEFSGDVKFKIDEKEYSLSKIVEALNKLSPGWDD